MKEVFLLLGSNSGDRNAYLEQAKSLIRRTIGPIRSSSGIFETEPWGFEATRFFLNQALSIQTALTPGEILAAIHRIEQRLGRIPSTERYASRTLDIDILLIRDIVVNEPDIQIPHPRMHLRKFTLAPLAEIAGSVVHPLLQKDILTLLEECDDPLKVRPFSPENAPGPLPWNFLCIEGNIGSGKTYLTSKLSEEHNTKCLLERFEDNPFLPGFYENPEKFAFPLEVSFLAVRYQQLIETFRNVDLFQPTVISDYFFDKSLVFARQTLNRHDYGVFTRLFRKLKQNLPNPDLIVFLYNSPEQLIENIKKRRRPFESSLSIEYLRRIQEGYMTHFRQIPNGRILILDTRSMDFVGNPADYRRLRSHLLQKYPPGIHRIADPDR